MAAKKKAGKSKSAARTARSSSAPKKPKHYTIDGATVTRHHPEGDSIQNFSSVEAAREYAASIPEEA